MGTSLIKMMRKSSNRYRSLELALPSKPTGANLTQATPKATNTQPDQLPENTSFDSIASPTGCPHHVEQEQSTHVEAGLDRSSECHTSMDTRDQLRAPLTNRLPQHGYRLDRGTSEKTSHNTTTTLASPIRKREATDRPSTSHAYHLHKCPSEPWYPLPGSMRRTQSANYLPRPSVPTSAATLADVRTKQRPSNGGITNDGIPTTMEASLLHQPDHQRVQNKHKHGVVVSAASDRGMAGRNETGDNVSDRSSGMTSGSSWVTTTTVSQQSSVDRDLSASHQLSESNRHVKPAAAYMTDVQTDRLIRHMEHVASVLKKKMDPLVYTNNKLLFLARILSTQDIQFGYHCNKYIKIGSGEFGEVLYGRMKDTGQLIAIKALKKDKTDMFALVQEAFMLQIASDSEFTPRYIGLAPLTIMGDKFQEWALIQEYVGSPHGPSPYDFRQTLKPVKTALHTPQVILEWIYTCAKIVHAVNQFHAKGILLNDIKADNILLKPVGNGYHPIFIDFGLASIGEGITLALEVNDGNRARILKEYSHIAPEILFGAETNLASDMFSLGKALSLVSDTFQLQPFANIISQCVMWEPSARPTIPALLNQFQWLGNAIVNRKL